MNILNESDMKKRLDDKLVYLENIENTFCNEELVIFFIECLEYCNKLSLFDYKEKIKKKICELGYENDIRLELVLNNPYLYVDNDFYSNNEYFIGKFKKKVINKNKIFSYKFQYDKYLRNRLYFEYNKQDVDYVIRNYKNILLNTDNKELYNSCLDRIYEIYRNNSFLKILDKDDINILEYDDKETNKDLVSIIVISYNNENYIEATIKSICEQTYENIEIIIADDCSKNLNIDKFIAIIEKYVNSNIKKIIIYKNKVNLGIVSNCNKAISISSGRYIKFIASDDVFYNKYVISDLIKNINYMKVEILSCESEINDLNMKHIAFTNNYKNLQACINNNNIIDTEKLSNLLHEEGSIIDTTSTIFSKNIFNKYGLFNEEYLLVEDWPFWIKLSSLGCKWGYMNLVCLKYRKGSGVTSLRPKSINNDMDRIWKMYYPHWEEKYKEILKYYT